MKIITIPVLAAALATTSVAPQAVFAAPLSIVSEVSSMDKVIEGLIAEIRTSKSLPGWAVNAAMNAYAVYKTYRNGERVEEIGATVLVLLKEVADIKADADKGREMTEREYRLTRELFDSYGSRLSGHEARLRSLESETKTIRAQLTLGRYRNHVCQQAEHVRRPNLCRSVHISVARLSRGGRFQKSAGGFIGSGFRPS